MREIKFRAWDNRNSKFIDTDTWTQVVITSNGLIFLSHTESIMFSEVSMERLDKEDVEILYNSGLKDIKGSDIYQGDLCLYDRNINESKDKEVFVVEYQDGALFIDSNSERIYMHDIRETEESIEVIGNIFENPELLGDSQ